VFDYSAKPQTSTPPPAKPSATPPGTPPGTAVLRMPVSPVPPVAAAMNPRVGAQTALPTNATGTTPPAAELAPGNAADPYVPDAKAVAEAERRNGPIFVDWPKPVFALMITGDLTGYIEPCGCAGLENLKGGLSRRHTLLTKLKSDGWPIAPIDLGGQVRRVGTQQTEIKLQATVKGLITMSYGAVGFGADDLRLPAATLLGAGLDPYLERTLPLTSADVVLFAPDSGATAPYRVIDVAGKRIGVTSVVGDSIKKTIQNDGVLLTPSEEALTAVVAKLKAEQCDLLVLLSYAEPAETEAIAKKFPEFSYVVTTGGADEPPGKYRLIGDRAAMIEVGRKGQHAIVLGFYDDPVEPVRYQRVPLDARFPESREMKQLLVEYQDQLRVAGFANLGITEKLHPRFDAKNPAAARYVGSDQCKDCHEAAFDIWKKSGHAHATETLVKLTPPRQFDPECLSCHVTGWDPQQYVPFQTGFLGLNETPLLTGSGCENCHGPGGAHVAAESGGDAALQKLLRDVMHVSVETVERNTCLKCHDHDNSPEFNFETYWPKVAH
jgi:hypothetical protein